MNICHWFEKCGGRPINVSYAPPTPWPEMNAYPDEVQRVMDECRHGVTVVTFKCSTCGKRFENRYLGDQRERFDTLDP